MKTYFGLFQTLPAGMSFRTWKFAGYAVEKFQTLPAGMSFRT